MFNDSTHTQRHRYTQMHILHIYIYMYTFIYIYLYTHIYPIRMYLIKAIIIIIKAVIYIFFLLKIFISLSSYLHFFFFLENDWPSWNNSSKKPFLWLLNKDNVHQPDINFSSRLRRPHFFIFPHAHVCCLSGSFSLSLSLALLQPFAHTFSLFPLQTEGAHKSTHTHTRVCWLPVSGE